MNRRLLQKAGLSLALVLALGRCSSESSVGVPDEPVDLGLDAGGHSVTLPSDSLPLGAISFFNRTDCPVGWTPYMPGVGRSVVPLAGQDGAGKLIGAALSDSEAREHTHQVSATLNLPSVTYVGIAGEANHGVARAGSVPMTVTSSTTSGGLPYIQLLICQKMVSADEKQRPAPAGTLIFFASASCPQGWTQPGLTQGRLLVGLPDKGKAGQRFGGPPLAPGEIRTHQHQAQGAIQTSSHGIALLSGAAADGYAQNGKHAYTATAKDASVDLPYVQLLQCQKM